MSLEAQDIFQSISDGQLARDTTPYALVDATHLRLAAVNYAFASMVGEDRLQLLGAYFDRFAPFNPQQTRAFDAMAAGWALEYTGNVRLPRNDGIALICTMRVERVKSDASGAFLLASFVMRQRIDADVDALDRQPEVILDRRYAIRTVSEDFAIAYDYTVDDLLERNFASLIHPDDLQAFSNVAAHSREGRLLGATIRTRIFGGDNEFHTWQTDVAPGRRRPTDLWCHAPVQRAAAHDRDESATEHAASLNNTKWNSLSPREHEVVTLVAQGLRVNSIAKELFVHPGTVRNHLSAIFKKVGAASQHELTEMLRDEPLTSGDGAS